MFCSKCGARLNEGAQFCTSCGTPVPAAALPTPPAPPIASPPAAAPSGPEYAPNPYAAAAPSYIPPSALPPVPGWAARPRVDYAGFWLRFVAWLIDSVIWTIPFCFIIAVMAAAMGVAGAFKNLDNSESPGDVAGALGLSFILMACLVFLAGRWLYYALMESSTWQGTLGKKALGLYVTDLSGNRINFARATGRYFGRIVSGLIPLEIGYIMAGFTEKRQALHDMIASCLVLRKL